MTASIKELAGATQEAMHDWAFDSIVDGGTESTEIIEQTDESAKIRCTLADGQDFYVTVTQQ